MCLRFKKFHHPNVEKNGDSHWFQWELCHICSSYLTLEFWIMEPRNSWGFYFHMKTSLCEQTFRCRFWPCNPCTTWSYIRRRCQAIQPMLIGQTFDNLSIKRKHILTRMHCSRMRTVRCSDRLMGGSLSSGCLPTGVWSAVSARGGLPVCPDGCTLSPPVDRILRLRTVMSEILSFGDVRQCRWNAV